MAAKDEAKEKDKEGKGKDEANKAKEKDTSGVINAVYKTHLHCPQCARKIKKHLLTTQGIHNVEVDMEKGEIKVKGVFDAVQIQKRLEKFCKKKIELVSPKIQVKENTAVEKKVETKETKQVETPSRKTLMKVHMHCEKCEQDLKKRLIKNKGIHNVKTDMKAQTLEVEGTIDPDKLISYLRRKVHKHAEIVPPKPEKKEEAKEKEKAAPKPAEKKTEEKKEKEKEIKGAPKPAEKKTEEKKEKEKEIKAAPKPAEKKTEEKNEKEKEIIPTEKSTETITKIVEVKGDTEVVEVKTKEQNAPYFIHYVYAPQTFSDENPNACIIM